ncbi:hypothetical protein BD410DRAFT_813828 [Rickenella mellea]|uniref:CENP-C homolog n=1 Tax=Rickenella mellea TaxID=50990 RepID=A0A4Y7QBL9_9AGAM|nr:hypothetical protein BD410DRAFT_813828 [Rickenella mellea]
MSQTRKSSVGAARRGTQRAHLPFREDDLAHGKRTGVSVNIIDHKSDDFEPFDKVLTQADGVIPPLLKGKNKGRKLSPAQHEDEDENGERSMEIDTSNQDTPNVYFSNAPRPSAPSSANRTATSSRAGHSDVNYDSIPSPRTAPRHSHVNGNSSAASNRSRSRLAQSFRAEEPPDDQPPNNMEYGDDIGIDHDYGAPQDSSSPDRNSPRRRSFSQMNESDEDAEDGQAEHPETPTRASNKGKGRQMQPEDEDPGVEDDIAQGLGGLEMEQHLDDEMEPESPPPTKKSKADEAKGKAPPKPRKKKQEKRESDTTGLRRGKRTRYAPLEHWRLEKVVYGRRESGTCVVPVIKDIIRIPKEEPQPLGVLGKRKRARSKSKTRAAEHDENQVIVADPEEGWDDDTQPMASVTDFVTGVDQMRRVVFTKKMVEPKPAANAQFAYQKIFGDGEFIAAGQLVVPPGGKKPSKGTKDNTYVFYLIEGAITLKIHRSSFILSSGGMFLVPRGNTYYIENICNREAKLFFAQARKIPVGEDDNAPTPNGDAPPRKYVNSGRRASGGGNASAGAPSDAALPRSSSAAPPRATKAAPGKTTRAVSK